MPALRCLGAGGTSLDMDSPAERVNEMRLSRRVEAPVGRAVRVAALVFADTEVVPLPAFARARRGSHAVPAQRNPVSCRTSAPRAAGH
jgi:hypothetical protein